MRRLIKKVILFTLVIFLIGITLSLFLPRNTYWGNKEYSWKIKEYKKDKYNTVMFGTSRIYRGINPILFDSMVNKNNTRHIKSFNLATHASWASETFYLYDAFLEDSTLSSGVDLVLMEFQNIMSIRPGKLGDEKSIYYQNLNHYWFMLKFSLFEVVRDPQKILTSVYSVGVYSLSTFLNVTNIRKINTKRDTTPPAEAESINSRGYLAFGDLRKGNVTPENIRSFTDNIETYLHRKNNNYNASFLELVTKAIEKSEKKGIRLIFALPPVRLTDGMIGVFNALPEENKIEVCDPKKFPELYQKENWIDPIHLNRNGATYLTQYFAKEMDLKF